MFSLSRTVRVLHMACVQLLNLTQSQVECLLVATILFRFLFFSLISVGVNIIDQRNPC